MAPSTPPPPRREELAAFTIASVVSSTISPCTSSSVAREPIRYRKRLLMFPLKIRQGFNAGQLLAFQKLQRSTAACRNMADLVGQAGLMHCGHRIPATHDGCCFPVGCNPFSNFLGPFGKC